MRGSRGLMRGRGGNQVVEDKQENSWCDALTSNDLHCWRSGKSYGRIDNRRLRAKHMALFAFVQRGIVNPNCWERLCGNGGLKAFSMAGIPPT